jgi:hypothetical protein
LLGQRREASSLDEAGEDLLEQREASSVIHGLSVSGIERDDP